MSLIHWNTSITCENGHVALNPSQECWFAKEVKLGDSVTLKAFPYTDSASILGLTFKWYKSGSYKGDEAELIVKDITKDNCTGYYSCMMRKNKEYFFSMYYCLRENTSENVDTAISAVTLNADKKDCLSLDKHLRVLRTDMWDIRAEWYDLGVQLDITPSTLEEIDCEQNGVEECFTVMLECWLSRNTPAPTWSALIEALKSDMIERGDIAQIIEARSKGEEPTTLDGGRLNVDKHLKEVINATSKLRDKWRNLGMELGITPTKLREIQNDHRITNACFTAVLTNWLRRTSPPPTWTALIKALRSPPVGRDDVADKIESTKLAR